MRECIALCLLLVVCLGPISEAVVIVDAGSGHGYEIVETIVTWDEARAAAEAMSYLGWAGQLASITSEGENTFVVEQVLGLGDAYWIGGFQPEGSVEPAGGWQWLSGEPFVYTNWGAGEPNNFRGWDENAVEIYRTAELYGTWNDLVGDGIRNYPGRGFVVEYARVPEPMTFLMLTLGGVLLLGRACRLLLE